MIPKTIENFLVYFRLNSCLEQIKSNKFTKRDKHTNKPSLRVFCIRGMFLDFSDLENSTQSDSEFQVLGTTAKAQAGE